MSNITTFYDTLLRASSELFPEKTKIPNPYDLTQNAENFLRDGYGITINGSSPEQGEFKNYEYGVLFSVVFAREVLKTNENTSVIETATKALFEDVHLARKDFYNVDQLGIDDNIQRIDLGASSGVEFILGDRFNFITVEVSFTAYIEEVL